MEFESFRSQSCPWVGSVMRFRSLIIDSAFCELDQGGFLREVMSVDSSQRREKRWQVSAGQRRHIWEPA